MELVGPTALEATWQYTMAKSASALPFVHAFQELSTAGAAKKKAKQSASPGGNDLSIVRREDGAAANGLRSVLPRRQRRRRSVRYGGLVASPGRMPQ